jgi:RecB family exonuclease
MTVYSYSRINCFLNCPAQFEHRYLKRTPSPVAEGVELFMGSRFHEAMEFLYDPSREGLPPTLQETLAEYHRCWDKALAMNVAKQKAMGYPEPVRISKEGMTLDDYRQKAEGFVENHYRKYHPFQWDKTEAIEMKVVFKLDAAGKYQMMGYIDRLAVDPEGTLWIHDYKTSSRKMTVEDAASEDQLALYMLGLRQIERYRSVPIRLQWHFVAFEQDEVVSDRTPDDLKVLRDRYVRHIKRIESAREFNTNTGTLCGWCEFLSLCRDGQAAVAGRERRAAERAAGGPPAAPTPAAVASSEAPRRVDATPPPPPEEEPPHPPGKRKKDGGQMSLFD